MGNPNLKSLIGVRNSKFKEENIIHMNAEIISFDCYGTLIDWKKGVLDALAPLFDEFLIDISKEEIFSLFLKFDAQLESLSYVPYKEILKDIMKAFSKELGLNMMEEDLMVLSDSLPQWPAFQDTVASLEKLKTKYKLAIISNIDNDLFQKTKAVLNVEFDYVISAEDVGSYKPSLNNFNEALKIFDIPNNNLLHCAQSLYHDISPCNQLEINNIWINRYGDLRPDFNQVKPIMEFGTISDLVDYLM